MAAQQQDRQRQPRTFRARRDVLNELNDAELIKRYRLDREGIVMVTDLVRDALTSPTARDRAISPELKVITLLRYLATGKLCGSNDLGLSQSTVSRIITQTLEVLSDSRLLSPFFRFPSSQQDIQGGKDDFLAIAGMPDVIGAIDCTHIRIPAPEECEEQYLNSKRYHSINVQIVFDARYRIINIVARWPGSLKDSHILSQSNLQRGFETGIYPAGCHLIGDSAYPSKDWLLTPILRPQPGYQAHYNHAHKRTVSVVKRGIRQWKRRFRVLFSEIRIGPPAKVCQIIKVCAMIHNLCKERNLHMPVEEHHDHDQVQEMEMDDDDGPPPPAAASAAERPREAIPHREAYAREHFMNED